MSNIVLLKPNLSRFSMALRHEANSDIDIFYVRDSYRQLKKAVNGSPGKRIVPDIKMDKMKNTGKYLKKYSAVNIRSSLPILERIVKIVSEENKLRFPLSEICLSADPETAVSMISAIKNTSKLFTVITNEEGKERLYDELYFKTGVIIRQIPGFIFNEKEDTMVIHADPSLKIPAAINRPVISLVRKNENDRAFYNAGSFFVNDGQADIFKNAWGGIPSLDMYTFLGILPKKDAVINISKKTDSIFLLDRSLF